MEQRHTATGVVRQLVRLASDALQWRYIVNATQSSYYIPEDLLDDANSIAVSVGQDKYWMRNLTADQRNALEEFSNVAMEELPQLDSMPCSTEELLAHPSWMAMKIAAANCIEKMGFRLDELENDINFQ